MWYLLPHSDSTSTDKICGKTADISVTLICDEIQITGERWWWWWWWEKNPQRSCRCIWAHIDECVKLMYQASHLQSCQVPAHMNRQLVGGRQQQQRWAFLSWLNLFPPSFALLNSHLLSVYLFLLFFSLLRCGRPPSRWTTHTHIHYTHTRSPTPSLSLFSLSLSLPLFPSVQWLYPWVQMDTMEASSQPLSYPWPCRFYSSLIQQLLSSMAIVKETAHHQCTAALLCSLLLFPSLSPMWHKGLSYTPPLLRLCQEPSSVRLLLYCMREIHLALCTRWSVKRESPFILQWGAECTGDAFAVAFFECCVELAADTTGDERSREAICF